MKSRVLFIPCNANQLESFVKIASTIKSQGQVHTVALIFDSLLHQGLKFSSDDFDEIIESALKSEKPFYLLNRLQQIRLLIALRRELAWLRDQKFDYLIHGADSAFMWLVISLLVDRPRVICVLDGFLAEPGWLNVLKYKIISAIRWLFGWISLQYLVPSVIGSNVNEKIYVMASSVAHVIRERGYRGVVNVSRLPRHKIKRKIKTGKSRRVRVLYATTAFAWHGYRSYAGKELMGLELLLNQVSDHCEQVELVVRIHPRGDRLEVLELTQKYPNISMVSERELEVDLDWSDIVLSAGSSISYEARLHGCHVGFWCAEEYGISDCSYIAKDCMASMFSSIADVVGYCRHKSCSESEIVLYKEFPYESVLK